MIHPEFFAARMLANTLVVTGSGADLLRESSIGTAGGRSPHLTRP